MSKFKKTTQPIRLRDISTEALERLYPQYKNQSKECQSIAAQIKKELKRRNKEEFYACL